MLVRNAVSVLKMLRTRVASENVFANALGSSNLMTGMYNNLLKLR